MRFCNVINSKSHIAIAHNILKVALLQFHQYEKFCLGIVLEKILDSMNTFPIFCYNVGTINGLRILNNQLNLFKWTN